MFRFVEPKKLEPAILAELERLRKQYEKGHFEALLYGIDIALRFFLLGSWMTEAFADRFGAWLRWEIPDLAAAFGVERKGRHAPHMRQREDLRWPIVSAIVEYRRQGILGEEAIEQTAEDFKVSKAFAEKLYHEDLNLRKLIEALPTLGFRLVKDGPRLHRREAKRRRKPKS
jgi:hypothetical protein